MINEKIGKALQCLRNDQGMSRREMASKSGLSVKAIEDVEYASAKNVHVEKIKVIADVLDIKLSEVFKKAEL